MPFLTQGKTNWKYILIMVFLTVIVGGIIYWQYLRQESETPAGWELYKSLNVGFSIKCPPEMEVELDVQKSQVNPTNYESRITSLDYEWQKRGMFLRIELLADLEKMDLENIEHIPSLEELIEQERRAFVSEPTEETIIIDKVSGTKFSLTNDSGYGFSILLRKDQRYYRVGGVVWAEKKELHLPVLNQMLSTFRFLE